MHEDGKQQVPFLLVKDSCGNSHKGGIGSLHDIQVINAEGTDDIRIEAQAGANFHMERSTMPRNRISSTTGAAITAIINVPNAFPPAIFSAPAFLPQRFFEAREAVLPA